MTTLVVRSGCVKRTVLRCLIRKNDLIDGSRIGREADRCIVDRAQGRMVPERVIDIGFSIVDRASL